MYRYFFIIPVFIIITWFWYDTPVYVQDNPCKLEDLVEDTLSLERAMTKMGPYYNYMISPDGKLFVNKGDGKWLILKY